MAISLDNAVPILSAAALGLLLLPGKFKGATVIRYIVGGGLLLFAVLQAWHALAVKV